MVFNRKLNPLDGENVNASFHRLSDYIGYLQESIEFTHRSDEKKISELTQTLKSACDRLEVLEGKKV